MPRTWSVCWEGDDVPFEGVSREVLPGFPNTEMLSQLSGHEVIFTQGEFQVRVSLTDARLVWWRGGECVLRDRVSDAYGLGEKNLFHALELSRETTIHGLGEASGPLNRRGRSFEMKNLDAMGYDAETTDPLYKHYPFMILRQGAGAVGIFYDNFSTTRFKLGSELDNYYGAYTSWSAEDGDIDYYVMLGPTVADVTKTFTRLTGRPALTPEWALGFSGSTMSYTDAPDAQHQLMGFLEKIAQTKLPCTSFHLSSGYTSIGKRRYVFHWNRDKIPAPQVLIKAFQEKGVRLIPNIKPVLLTDHPKYTEAKELFIQTSDGPELSQFWDGRGSHLDFTNPHTVSWWQNNCREQLTDLGIEALWNDNNEFQVWDHETKTNSGYSMALMRPIQTMLMAKASRGVADFVISRSGMPGMQRYVQSWSGDNYTDWKTLPFNLTMALNLTLSGFSNTGHDIGGFAGPRPSPELFVRWIQHGIFYPRFVIHSWKDVGVNEPWMYTEVLDHIRSLFLLREKLTPYFRRLQVEARENFTPFLRPLFHDYPQDKEASAIEDQFLVGPSLLVANVFEEGAKTRRFYLPAGEWVDWWSQKKYTGAQWLTWPVTLESWPLFVKAGDEL
jgi:alpha-glucosidase